MIPGVLTLTDTDEADTGFDKTTCKKTALAHCGAAVFVSKRVWFFGDLKRFLRARTSHQFERRLVITVECVECIRRIPRPDVRINKLQQAVPGFHTSPVDA